METVSISQLKTKCLALLEKVRTTGEPLRVTRRGEPSAEVIPPPPAPTRAWLGAMKGTGRVDGDIVSPAADEEDWEALGS
jgi:prevent-host-death family protein